LKKTLFILISVLFFTFCKKEEKAEEVNFHYNYIPTSVGQWNEYEVTEITHTSTGAHDTLNYYLKEVVTEEITTNKYRVERFSRNNLVDNWIIKDVWTREKTNSLFQQVEENISYTKLIFPIKNNQYWNGNAYNSNDELTYEYDLIHEAYSINNINFDSTVTVIQQDNVNAIEYQKAEEVYAKHAGLIYKSKKDLSINLFDVTDINDGTELEMKLINYGN
jgi:hypothetical protein